MSLTAALRASNLSQPNPVTEIKYNSLNSTARDHGPITGTKETSGHRLCDAFWHGTGAIPASRPTSRPARWVDIRIHPGRMTWITSSAPTRRLPPALGATDRQRSAQNPPARSRAGAALATARPGVPGELGLGHHAISALTARASAADLDPDSISFAKALRLIRRTATATADIPPQDWADRLPTTWPRSPRCSCPRGASGPVPARSNAPGTTATGSKSPASRPALATEHRPKSTSTDLHHEHHDQLKLRGIAG
jgi:hypothetical protein